MDSRRTPLYASLFLLAACSSSSDGGLDKGDLYDGYGTSSLSLPVRVAMSPLTPQNPSTKIKRYKAEPGLPAGLSLDKTTGVLSGTPTSLVGPKKFKITAESKNKQDTSSITIEVRGPLVGLDSDLGLVRSYGSAGSPVSLSTGGVTTATAAVTTTTPTVTASDASTAAVDDLSTLSGAPVTDSDPVPGDEDATADFTADVAVDDSELSADPWTLDAQAPYDDDGLVVATPSFPVDTSTVVIEDGELKLAVELAGEGLGPFDSVAIPTERLDYEPVTDTLNSMRTDWITANGAFYFQADTGSERALMMYDPDAVGGPVLEQVVDLNSADDDADLVALVGGWLMVDLVPDGATERRLHAYDPVNDVLVEVSAENPGDAFRADEIEALGGALYLVSQDSTPSGVVMRWTPPVGATPATFERVSYTAANVNDPDDAFDLIPLGGMLYFLATDGTNTHLYRFDPNTSTQERLSDAGQADVVDIDDVDGELYAIAQGPGGLKLFHWDEVAGVLEQIVDIAGSTLDDDPEIFDELDDGLHFFARLSSGERRFFRYDPSTTPPTLEQLVSIAGSGTDEQIGEVLRVGDELLLAATDDVGDGKLFAYDYVTGVTRKVVDVDGPGSSDSPDDMLVMGDGRVALAFEAVDTGGYSLFLYDPETKRVTLAADPSGAGVDDDVYTLAVDGDKLYFLVRDGSSDTQVWVLQ